MIIDTMSGINCYGEILPCLNYKVESVSIAFRINLQREFKILKLAIRTFKVICNIFLLVKSERYETVKELILKGMKMQSNKCFYLVQQFQFFLLLSPLFLSLTFCILTQIS